MATELELLSQNQPEKLAQPQPQQQRQKSSMWNCTSRFPTINNHDSWEVRAFAEDTGSAMGTTWPPRFYTCTFCQREFRSAQALGGHMNVHRRDRAHALLQQSQQESALSLSAIVASSSSPTVFSSPELVVSGGSCVFYQIPHPGSVSTSASRNSPSLYTDAHLLDKLGMMRDVKVEDSRYGRSDESIVAEEMDLELRLGR